MPYCVSWPARQTSTGPSRPARGHHRPPALKVRLRLAGCLAVRLDHPARELQLRLHVLNTLSYTF
eukprot:1193316-Prorocentrum_minimum.AAC.3